MSRKAGAKPDDPSLTARPAHSFNSNIRLYKYTEGQYFGCHYDDWVSDPVTGTHSEWTVLIYLSGKEDGIVGGEVSFTLILFVLCERQLLILSSTFQTIFYTGEGKKKDKEPPIKPELRRGMTLFHR